MEYALQKKLPIVYLSANSGAKFGLAKELTKFIKVQWINSAQRSKGIDYLYFT